MMLGELVLKINSRGLNFRPRGFINVEGGLVAVSTQYRQWCDCTDPNFFPSMSHCPACGRAGSNFSSMPAGNGDGVYVVFEIYSNENPAEALGALVVFDHGYEIANAVRVQVENEKLTDLSLEMVEKFADTIPLHLTTLDPTSTILIGDSPVGEDSRNATVGVSFPSPRTNQVFAFVRHLSQDPKDVALRLQADLGMDHQKAERALALAEAIFRAGGKETGPVSPDIDFRAMLVIDSSLAGELGLRGEVEITDWETLNRQFLASTGTSHVEPQYKSAVFFNALLARELDRLAGEVVSDEDAKRLLFDVWTWAYQGLENGDERCQVLLQNRYSPSREEVATLLRRRGQFKAAENYIGSGSLEGEEGTSGAFSNAQSGLTKSSSGGLGLSSATSSASHCKACGSKFSAVSDPFCAECGLAN